jgi:hypothetical protein
MENARADANRVAYSEFLTRLEQAMRRRGEEPALQRKPIRFIARCARCGRAKNQHRAAMLECPRGNAPLSGMQSSASSASSELTRDQCSRQASAQGFFGGSA